MVFQALNSCPGLRDSGLVVMLATLGTATDKARSTVWCTLLVIGSLLAAAGWLHRPGSHYLMRCTCRRRSTDSSPHPTPTFARCLQNSSSPSSAPRLHLSSTCVPVRISPFRGHLFPPPHPSHCLDRAPISWSRTSSHSIPSLSTARPCLLQRADSDSITGSPCHTLGLSSVGFSFSHSVIFDS